MILWISESAVQIDIAHICYNQIEPLLPQTMRQRRQQSQIHRAKHAEATWKRVNARNWMSKKNQRIIIKKVKLCAICEQCFGLNVSMPMEVDRALLIHAYWIECAQFRFSWNTHFALNTCIQSLLRHQSISGLVHFFSLFDAVRYVITCDYALEAHKRT